MSWDTLTRTPCSEELLLALLDVVDRTQHLPKWNPQWDDTHCFLTLLPGESFLWGGRVLEEGGKIFLT